MVEYALAIVKPEAVNRGRMGDILDRYEKRLKVVALQFVELTQKQVEELYIEHRERSFYNGAVQRMLLGPVLIIILEGNNAVEIVRTINGTTWPEKALPGTIRGDLANSVDFNMVHGAADEEAVEREIRIFFPKGIKFPKYKRPIERWEKEAKKRK